MSKDTEKEIVNKLKSSADGKRHYELSFHIVATIDEERAKKNFDKVVALVEKNGGKLVNQSNPAKLDLRYQMFKDVDSVKQRHNSAYFAWVIFEGETDKVEEIKEEMDENNEILRYLILTTDSSEGKTSAETAEMLKPEEEERSDYKKRREEKEVVEVSEEAQEEDATEKTENQDSEKANEEKVDEAIDELVKE